MEMQFWNLACLLKSLCERDIDPGELMVLVVKTEGEGILGFTGATPPPCASLAEVPDGPQMNTDGSIQRELEVHRKVESKLAELGVQDSCIAEITAGLGDLYGAFEAGVRLIDSFLDLGVDRGKVTDMLVDFRYDLRHIEYHIRSLKKPLEALIDNFV